MLHQIIINAGPVLAETGDISAFFKTGVGTLIGTLLAAAGTIVIIVGIFKGVKDVLAGSMGKAAKTVLGTVLIGAFLIFPASIITSVTNTANSLIGNVSNEVDKTVDNNGKFQP